MYDLLYIEVNIINDIIVGLLVLFPKLDQNDR